VGSYLIAGTSDGGFLVLVVLSGNWDHRAALEDKSLHKLPMQMKKRLDAFTSNRLKHASPAIIARPAVSRRCQVVCPGNVPVHDPKGG
jgi:hypothetical protein